MGHQRDELAERRGRFGLCRRQQSDLHDTTRTNIVITASSRLFPSPLPTPRRRLRLKRGRRGISGPTSLGQNQRRVLTLASANAYSGAPPSAAARCFVNNTTASGDRLGTGSPSPMAAPSAAPAASRVPSLVNSGGTLAPGTPQAVLTLSNTLALAPGSLTIMQVSRSPLTNTLVRTYGALTRAAHCW